MIKVFQLTLHLLIPRDVNGNPLPLKFSSFPCTEITSTSSAWSMSKSVDAITSLSPTFQDDTSSDKVTVY